MKNSNRSTNFCHCCENGKAFRFNRKFTVVALLWALISTPIWVAAQDMQGATETVYESVDELPYLKGHRKNTKEFLQKQAVYPAGLKVRGIEGAVHVSFVVSSQGKVSNAKIDKGKQVDLDEEALRVVFGSGPWVPAKVKGQYVASKMSTVVMFSLTDAERKLAEVLKPIDFEKKPPLFVLDGKRVDAIIEIEHYNVKSIRVLKGEKAIAKYGEMGGNGVVEVTTKNGTPPVR